MVTKLAKMTCKHCGTTKNLQEHHVTYDDPANVIVLCVSCHSRLHGHATGNPKILTNSKPSKAYFHDGKVWSKIWKNQFTSVPLAVRKLLNAKSGDVLEWHGKNGEVKVVVKKK